MKIKVRALTENIEVLNRCRVTVWKDAYENEPSTVFMDNIYKAEHSPIRDKIFHIEIRGIKSWIATHFVRHHVGCTPYVATQRDDRIDYTGSRDDRPQGELVNMDLTLNAAAVISISRKRLCGQAHIETQKVWEAVLEQISIIDGPLFNNCVPECVYRGFCPELKPCNNGIGRCCTPKYIKWRKQYVANNIVIPIDRVATMEC